MNTRCQSHRGRSGQGVGRLIRLWTTLLAGLTVSLSPARAEQNHFFFWSQLGVDGVEWVTTRTQSQIIEGLTMGLDGYIVDPYLASFKLSTGIEGQHANWVGDWINSLGWSAGATLSLFPMSRFPITLTGQHTTRGLVPGGHPDGNLNSVTEFGGNWLVGFEDWPEVRIGATHTIIDTGLMPTGLDAVQLTDDGPNQQSLATTEATLQLRKSSGAHRYDMEVEFIDETRRPEDSRRRVARFRANDQSELSPGLTLTGMVDGQRGGLTTAESSELSPFSDYRGQLQIQYAPDPDLRVTGTEGFWQAGFLDGELLGNELVGELLLQLVPGVELFSGLAVTYLDEQLGDSRQRLLREQLAGGARLDYPVPIGELRGRAVVRGGGAHLLGVGSGAAVNVDADFGWEWRITDPLRLRLGVQSLTERDWSPLGLSRDSYVGRLSFQMTEPRGFVGDIEIFAGHHRNQEMSNAQAASKDPGGDSNSEPVKDTFTEVGIQTNVQYIASELIQIQWGVSWALSLTSLLGTEHVITGELQALSAPARGLLLSARALGSARFDKGGDPTALLQAEASVGWTVRQLRLEVGYRYLLDDFRGTPGGEHLITFRLTRRIETRFGLKEKRR